MPEPTVSAGYAKALIDVAVARGADHAELLKQSKIAAEDLDDLDRRIPMASYVALMRAGKDLCNEPALGLKFSEVTDIDQVSIVGLICRTADTMGEALGQLNRYGRLVAEIDLAGSGPRFNLAQRGDELWLEDTRANPNSFIELTESTFARFICEFARYYPGVPFVKEIHVTHHEPSYRHEYDRILKVPVVFASDRNAMLIEPSWLSTKINNANPYAFGILSERADALLETLRSSESTKGIVESILIPRLHTGEFRMEDVAKEMGLGRQTLYRKLKAEGVRFEDLLDNLRQTMALHYLDGQKVSVNETAYLVGFSDPSAFSRAFKRWTGKSPSVRRVK